MKFSVKTLNDWHKRWDNIQNRMFTDTLNERRSRTADVYEYLKNHIMFRQLPPGTQLVENMIGKELQVSRTPIRNAMKKLEQEGLVKIYSNRGAFVVEPTLEEIRQAFDMRRHLEKMTLEQIYDQMNEEDFVHLEEWIEHERKTYETRNILEYLDVNKQFHMTLALKTKNRFLIDFTERILNQINVYLMLYDVFVDEDLYEKQRFKEHELLLEALRNKDLSRLLQLIDQHMEESLNYMSITQRKDRIEEKKKSL
ncbi:DNA-binding transcriptional regulator, GntR family [Halobacillus aidingensis]|uniref:DNA-binding transcriptional regulator, GntR family n=1 Tax=Halobacillus aidingensis TaxID=240303 RepID=A0A1H0JJG8_HALAD|nr:DNA-binding transcriptional regulator, GntR family [Halobacillus aidingensis]